MLGKGLISVTFCCLYVFTNEIFPTEVRNVGVGSAVMFGGVSNMAAAYFGGPLVSRFLNNSEIQSVMYLLRNSGGG